MSAFVTRRFELVSSPQESAELAASRLPSIVISSSGMATGGRVLNHLKAALPNPDNAVLFSGFQAAGTRGRKLVDGEREVKIHGRMVPVAARIEKLDSMSAHADAVELVRWLSHFRRPPDETCLVHGEPESMEAFKLRVEERFGWRVRMPDYLETIEV